MKNLNLYFVGYFLNKEDKMKYVDLFDCKDKFFLESSKINSKTSGFGVKYFSELLYTHNTNYKDILNNEPIFVDSFVKELYKRDFRHFKASTINIKKIKDTKKRLLFLYYSIHLFNLKNKGFSRLNILNYLMEFFTLVKKYRNKDSVFFEEFKNFFFRVNFILGYKYSQKLLKSLNYNKNDVFIIWGKSYSSRLLLINHLEKNKVPFFISEYGEISGTISCSPDGIFGEVFSQKSWIELCKKEVTKDDIEYTKNILDQVRKNQISTRTYGDNIFFLVKYFYDNSIKKKEESRQKVIYVNGSELFSSGLFDNRWNINNQGKHPNKMLLDKVVSYFDNDEYMIMYKEHPMSASNNKKALLHQSDFPTVNFISDMNIHDILEIADIIITFPSKVVITSLLYKKTTFVLGDFTIPVSIPSIRYFTSNKFEDIGEMFTSKEKPDDNLFTEIIARLIKYSLIVYDKNLHYKYDYTNEQNKLKNIIS